MRIRKAVTRHETDPLRWIEINPQSGRVAILVCQCGNRLSLEQYTIEADGTVRPSVFCTYGCGFNNMITLDKWEPGKAKK